MRWGTTRFFSAPWIERNTTCRTPASRGGAQRRHDDPVDVGDLRRAQEEHPLDAREGRPEGLGSREVERDDLDGIAEARRARSGSQAATRTAAPSLSSSCDERRADVAGRAGDEDGGGHRDDSLGDRDGDAAPRLVEGPVDPHGIDGLAEDRPGEQGTEQEAVDRLGVAVRVDVAAGGAALQDLVHGGAVGVEDAGPERRQQLGVAALLGEQRAEDGHAARRRERAPCRAEQPAQGAPGVVREIGLGSG